MKLLTWTNIRLLLMIFVVIFLFSFTSHRNAMRKIAKTEVVFVGENSLFLKPETVNKLLIEKNQDLKTINKDGLDLNKLEKTVSSHPMVHKADVFVSVDGVLKAVVEQKQPLGRVFEETGSFYLDYEGNKMPLSDNFAARVPLVSGEITAVKKEKLAEVGQKYGANIEQTAVAWLIQLGTLPIIGSLSEQRIRNAVSATEIKLNHEDWYEIYNVALMK